MPSKLRAAVIGTGQIGKAHLRNYANMPDVELVAVCDIREDEAKRVAEMHNVPRVLTDYKKLLKMDDIDSVDVCLHNQLHAPVSIAALEAGKHVYCEKPIAPTGKEARAMLAARDKAGKILMVQCGTIFSAESRAAKAMIDSGALGSIYLARTWSYRRRGRPYVDGYGSQAFVQKKQAAGGALLDIGIYHVSRLLWLVGNPAVKSVSARAFQEVPMDEKRRKDSGYDVEEGAVGFVRFDNGLTLTAETFWAIHAPAGHGDAIYGSLGGMQTNPLRVHTDIGGIESDATVDAGQPEGRRRLMDETFPGYESSQAHFVWAVLGRVAPIDTAAVTTRFTEIAEAMYQSSDAGAEVVLG
jgi:predicted dehydrogenase